MFCTDDREPNDLFREGSIDNNIRMAIKYGIDPIDAIKMATINTSIVYRLNDIGAIAPGYKANFIVFNDLYEFKVEEVYKEGIIVAKDNNQFSEKQTTQNNNLINTVNMKKLTKEELYINENGNYINIIKIEPHNLVTKKIKINADKYYKDDDKIYSKIVVIERHNKTGKFGIGVVEGFNIRNGAIASTVAHDSHNVVVVGDNDDDILLAVEELSAIGGGLVLVKGGEILGELPLEIGGLMSNKPLSEVAEKLENLQKLAYDELCVSKDIEPFMTLSFLSLPVIPEIKVTDRGLFDVVENKFIDLIE
jgi:adenine deaminase